VHAMNAIGIHPSTGGRRRWTSRALVALEARAERMFGGHREGAMTCVQLVRELLKEEHAKGK
jgi:hypothetical protein